MLMKVIYYVLIVGIGSTIALDLWARLMAKLGWLPGTHWPAVGRWITGLFSGNFIFDSNNTSPFTKSEAILGWGFHYVIGIIYAAMYPLFWGFSFIVSPIIFPFFFIGVIVSSIAGLAILMPGMGGGFFANKVPNRNSVIVYVLLAHLVFAVAQYLLAKAVIQLP
ncbi:DUF2938 domain-containing protein [Acinetobacter tandoii]|nr:DUF2938 domain-containing protein [Acinetobacter tandoii]